MSLSPSPQGPAVLFGFSIVHYFREMLPVAVDYRRRGYEVHVVIGYAGPAARDAAARCEALDLRVSWWPRDLRYGAGQDGSPETGDAGAADGPGQPTRSGPRGGPGDPSGRGAGILGRVAARALAGMRLAPGVRPASAFGRLVRRGVRVRRYAESLVAAIRPAVVFGGPYHSCGQIDNGLARVCRRRRIPYVCLPTSPYWGERQATLARFANLTAGMVPPDLEADRSALNRALAWAFPAWVRARDGKRIFMFPPLEMAAAKLTGLLDENPWQKPSVLYDTVFAYSEFSRDMLVASGYDAGRVEVVGNPQLDDVLAGLEDEGRRVELCRSMGLAPDRPYLLVNVEPSAEHRYASWEDHWRRFRALMGAIAGVRKPTVLSLHPLCDPVNYRFVEAEYGFRIGEAHISRLYPYCGAVVSFPCSTNVMGMVFRKPLLIYDFFGLTTDPARREFHRLPGAKVAGDVEELPRAVAELVEAVEWDKPVPPGVASADRACDSISRRVRERYGV